eukprot:CAMPEP_0168728710 /NCGR_PEP_ID=MMETSP0724-20121128/5825_1 /TAXON_ID=265536 /ORGANISM="Amphiprora sp., Strain CCMP467" /LENGTH=150 /DNA_ID=CAMNT_0008775565 /DNA_START=29 /DNA_END=477 /DNA_ORIENTATION=+
MISGGAERTTRLDFHIYHGVFRDDESFLPLLLEALRAATMDSPIEAVRLHSGVLYFLSPNQVGTLLEHLAYLPRLKVLAMSFGNEGFHFDATHVAKFLQRAQSIEKLSMGPIVTLSETSLQLLTEALHQHPTLQSIHFLNLTTSASLAAT